MEEVWGLIGLTILVSIIFGISLQSAFWGIVIFIVCFIVILFLTPVILNGALHVSDWLKTKPEDKPAKPKIQEAVIAKKKTPVQIKKEKKERRTVVLFFLGGFLIGLVILGGMSLMMYGDLSFGIGH